MDYAVPNEDVQDGTARLEKAVDNLSQSMSEKIEELATTLVEALRTSGMAAQGEESRGRRRADAVTTPFLGGRTIDEPPLSGAPEGGNTRESADGNCMFGLGGNASPKFRQLSFDGLDENWPLFRDDFLTQVNALGLLGALRDSRNIVVHQATDEKLLEQGLSTREAFLLKNLWATLVNSISDKATRQLVYQCGGPGAAWRKLEQTFAPVTGGEQISLIGKFFNAHQKTGQEPRIFWQEFSSIVASLEMAFDQPIPQMLVHARFLDGLSSEYEIQKQQLLSQKTLEIDEVLRVLRTRAGILKAGREAGDRQKGVENQALVGVREGGRQRRKQRQKQQRQQSSNHPAAGAEAAVATGRTGNDNAKKPGRCFICHTHGDHFPWKCPSRTCIKCGGKGHSIADCPSTQTIVDAVVAVGESSAWSDAETEAF